MKQVVVVCERRICYRISTSETSRIERDSAPLFVGFQHESPIDLCIETEGKYLLLLCAYIHRDSQVIQQL